MQNGKFEDHEIAAGFSTVVAIGLSLISGHFFGLAVGAGTFLLTWVGTFTFLGLTVR
jgi:hypothetical protein